MSDNLIEADCGSHNIRVFRNRGFNVAAGALSAQPIYGGPCYFIRNIVYHAPRGGAFKYNIYPIGVLTYHNTLCSEWAGSPLSKTHLRNNLFLERTHQTAHSECQHYTSSTTFDYNGYRPNRNSRFSSCGGLPGGGKTFDYDLKEPLGGSFKTLEEFFKARAARNTG